MGWEGSGEGATYTPDYGTPGPSAAVNAARYAGNWGNVNDPANISALYASSPELATTGWSPQMFTNYLQAGGGGGAQGYSLDGSGNIRTPGGANLKGTGFENFMDGLTMAAIGAGGGGMLSGALGLGGASNLTGGPGSWFGGGGAGGAGGAAPWGVTNSSAGGGMFDIMDPSTWGTEWGGSAPNGFPTDPSFGSTTPGSPTGFEANQGYWGQGAGMPSMPPGVGSFLQQLLGGGGAQPGGQAGGMPGGFNLGSLLPLLGIGSGLNTMFNPPAPAVDPSRINALWNAGQQTYNTALDPQNALYNRTAAQTQDQTRAAESARGITMGPYGAGVEANAMNNFNIDWQNAMLGRQAQGTQALAGAGNTAANAGLANNAQAFMQNQTGLNNLTTGLGGMFGGTGSPGAGAAGGNQIGQWLTSMMPGAGGSAGTPGAGNYSVYNDPNANFGGYGGGYYGAS